MTASLLAAPSSLLARDDLTGSLTSSLIKSSMMLLLVIAIILAMAWLLRKSQQLHASGQHNMTLLETLPLGRQEKLCLVRSGNKYLLLGVTANGINRLDEIPEDQVETGDSAQNAWHWAQQYLQRQPDKNR
ncbi:MAG: flagellar biosynthetic protein FliO [Endozoicomonas sp.]